MPCAQQSLHVGSVHLAVLAPPLSSHTLSKAACGGLHFTPCPHCLRSGLSKNLMRHIRLLCQTGRILCATVSLKHLAQWPTSPDTRHQGPEPANETVTESLSFSAYRGSIRRGACAVQVLGVFCISNHPQPTRGNW